MRILLAALLAAAPMTAFAGACPVYDFDATGINAGSGDTCGAVNDDTGSCGATNAEDVSYLWTAPTTARFGLNLAGSGYDTVAVVRDYSSCTELVCNDDYSGLQSYVEFDAIAGQQYVLQIDGFSTACGAFTFTIAEAVCPDSDGDGVCDTSDLCYGDDAYGDTDGDGTCDDLDICYGFDGSGDSDGDGTCDNLDFTLATGPIAAASPLTLQATNAPTGTRVYFLAATTTGTTCHPSGAVCMDLARPVVLGSVISDGAGTATLTIRTPGVLPPAMHFQAGWIIGAEGDKTQLVNWP